MTFEQRLKGTEGDSPAVLECVSKNNSPLNLPVDSSEVNGYSFIEMVVPFSFSFFQFIPQAFIECFLCGRQGDGNYSCSRDE